MVDNVKTMLLNLFRKPSADEMAVKERDQARRSLLEAQSAKEYAASLEAYHQARITRLDKFLKGKE